MSAAAQTLIMRQSTNRKLWLYDTFQGMSKPTSADEDFLGRHASGLLQSEDPDNAKSIWCRSALDEVRQTMNDSHYPEKQIRFVPGMVEETLPTTKPQQIAVLRLDTDWYESTLCELQHLFPRLSDGGVLIIDDYGHWDGCRRAVDEYFADHQINMFLHRIDYTGRMGIKHTQIPTETRNG